MRKTKKRQKNEYRNKDTRDHEYPILDKISQYMNTPVDENLFLFCSNLYSAAAQMKMPVENPAAKPIIQSGGKLYSFADIPMNRGMLAVMKELSDQNATKEIKMSMTWRIMHFGDVLRETDRFSNWIRVSNVGGTMDVAESLIRACASAKMAITKEYASFDLDDVERLAIEITTRLEAKTEPTIVAIVENNHQSGYEHPDALH